MVNKRGWEYSLNYVSVMMMMMLHLPFYRYMHCFSNETIYYVATLVDNSKISQCHNNITIQQIAVAIKKLAKVALMIIFEMRNGLNPLSKPFAI